MRSSRFTHLFAVVLSALLLAFAPAVLAEDGAESEAEIAAAFLVELGVYRGDDQDNLNLDKGMTRAELAAFLARLDFFSFGASALEMLPELTESAQLKARDLLDNDYFAHESPTYGSASEMIWSFVLDARFVGENIALGYSTPQAVMNGWMHSSGHRKNILDKDFTHIGIGAVHGEIGGIRWVQQFAGY
jgi:hypothetical protein